MTKKLRLSLLAILFVGIAGLTYFWLQTTPKTQESGIKVKIRQLVEAPKKHKEAPAFSKNDFTPESVLKAKLEQKRAKRQAGYTRRTDKPDLYAEMYQKLKTKDGESTPSYVHGYQNKELKRARALQSGFKTQSRGWVSRGPANVPGRTRAFIALPSDPVNNWIAGAAGGGVWKTTDQGATWTDKTPDFSSLSIANLAMSGNTIYAGTGEIIAGSIEVNGDGIYKSTDEGETWVQIPSTASNDMFRNVTRIVVDPNNADVMVVVSSNYNRNARVTRILRTTNGGDNWTTVYTHSGLISQISYKPDDFDIQLAAITGVGIIKSTDGGLTWGNSSNGISDLNGRLEIAFSPTNPSKVYLSAVGSASGNASDLYASDNAGNSWSIVLEESGGTNQDFLGGQGSYDNTIVVNPYDEDEVYLGGVSLWKMNVSNGTGSVFNIAVEEDGTDAFMTYSNFGFSYLGGGLEVDQPNTLDDSDITNVEVRFGTGLTQMAHRFTVNGQGSGVAPTGYFYEDYVEVPFQVWDVTNNRQLMVSFRDQGDNDVWDLVAGNFTAGDEANHSREYTFIHDVEYNATTPDANIGQDGGAGIGHQFRQMYFIAPQLEPGFTFNPATLPTSKLAFTVDPIAAKTRITTNVTDSYGGFGGKNGWTNTATRDDGGVHPDHHLLTAIEVDPSSDIFMLVDCSDGGVYYSNSAVEPGVNDGDWSFGGMGYITSQFHGVDKMPGEQVYIGGMQDNSVWRSPLGQIADNQVLYSYMGAGDGFDCIWHRDNPNLILSGSQFNSFIRTTNAGVSWTSGTNGLGATGQGNGSFFSPLGSSQTNPDLVFTVGPTGVWRSENFAASWTEVPINTGSWGGIGGIPQIKVSDADNTIVWAGNGMTAGINIHVSTDAGRNFTATNNFANFGAISGFAIHPTEPNTAYAMFSFAGSAKIVRTTDLGQTWEDITGFDSGAPSTNGFPDVAVFDLVVLPFETNTIWAGTEIGMFESNDNGATWHMLDSDLPAVAVYDIKLVDNELIIGTHGRGIWTTEFSNLPSSNPSLTVSINDTEDIISIIEIPSAFDSTQLLVDGNRATSTTQTGNVEITLSGYAPATYTLKAVSYFNGTQYESQERTITLVASSDIASFYQNDFETATTDFTESGLSIRAETSFTGSAIHSAHNYADNTNNTIVLDKAIKIAATSAEAFMKFNEVAIIEKGEPGSVFGDADFWDYVIVETSYDKATWYPVAHGYDASADAAWLAAEGTGSDGTEAMIKERRIDLINSVSPLEAGDVVYFRFRLFSDGAVPKWGWMIDNLLIQVENFVDSPTLSVNVDAARDIVSTIVTPSVADSTQLLVDGNVERTTFSTGNVEIRLSGYSAGNYTLKAISYVNGVQYESNEATAIITNPSVTPPTLSVDINSSKEIASTVVIPSVADSTQLLINGSVANTTFSTGSVDIDLSGYTAGTYTVKAVTYVNGVAYDSNEETVVIPANPTLSVSVDIFELISNIDIATLFDSTQLVIDGTVVSTTFNTGSVEIRTADNPRATYTVKAISYFKEGQYESNTETIAVTSIEDDIKANQVGLEVYPNPASARTTLKYFLPQASEVTFNVIDNTGKIVKILNLNSQSKGLHDKNLPLTGLAKGSYIIQIKSSTGTNTSRLVIQ